MSGEIDDFITTPGPSTPRCLISNDKKYVRIDQDDVSINVSRNSHSALLANPEPVEQPKIRRDHWPEIRRNRISRNVEPGAMNVISANYESLDYDLCENFLYLDEERRKGYKYVVKKNIARWLIFLFIGMCTAFVGIFVDISIEELAKIKFKTIKQYIDDNTANNRLYVPYAIWIVFNAIPVLIGSALVAYIEPMAAGSGIPQVKCYLNGVKIPRVVRIKTLAVKSIGVITTVVGGLAGGKEGPMIHCGAVVAAGISQGKSTTFGKDLGILKYFREDHEKRDFVSGGAAAGVAAAFGAPVGGVLFSLEEGASFWNQSLTWRIFFASMVSTFTLNIVLSTYHGYPGKLSFPGLLNFGKFGDLSYELFELVIYVGMGALGGLSGALFNYINYKLAVIRIRSMRRKWIKVLEAVLVAVISAVVGFVLIHYSNDCQPIGRDSNNFTVQMHCPTGQYNAVAALFLQVPEASVRSFFHDRANALHWQSIVMFLVAYYGLSVFTYGISVSMGLFIPSLLIGAAWGRLCGMILEYLFPGAYWLDVGKYALIGAAAQLGGIVRMTISLTVILIEATGNITFGLPLMITLITAKWVGDFFTEGIYDIYIQLSGIPLLAWEPPPLSSNVFASEIMSHPVITLKTVENAAHIMDVLSNETYNGFPVVDPLNEQETQSEIEPRPCGHLRGLILRSQLIVLLQNKIFNESPLIWDCDTISLKMFRNQYPRYPEIKDVKLTDEERRYTIDLRPFMNRSPYVVQHITSLPRVFRLFRALGLRHLIVINDTNQVVGVVSRKDLARYKVWRHLGTINVEELQISNDL